MATEYNKIIKLNQPAQLSMRVNPVRDCGRVTEKRYL